MLTLRLYTVGKEESKYKHVEIKELLHIYIFLRKIIKAKMEALNYV